MMRRDVIFSLLLVHTMCSVTACGGGSLPGRKSAWDNIDYSKIARQHKSSDYDDQYVAPSSAVCASDDDRGGGC